MGLSNSYPNEINPMAVQSPELNLSRHTRVSSPTRFYPIWLCCRTTRASESAMRRDRQTRNRMTLVTPEPGTVLLLGLGLTALGAGRRRTRGWTRSQDPND